MSVLFFACSFLQTFSASEARISLHRFHQCRRVAERMKCTTVWTWKCITDLNSMCNLQTTFSCFALMCACVLVSATKSKRNVASCNRTNFVNIHDENNRNAHIHSFTYTHGYWKCTLFSYSMGCYNWRLSVHFVCKYVRMQIRLPSIECVPKSRTCDCSSSKINEMKRQQTGEQAIEREREWKFRVMRWEKMYLHL